MTEVAAPAAAEREYYELLDQFTTLCEGLAQEGRT